MTIPARCVAANLHDIVFTGMQNLMGKKVCVFRFSAHDTYICWTPRTFFEIPEADGHCVEPIYTGDTTVAFLITSALFSSRPHHFQKETSTVICTEPVLEPIRWLSLAVIRTREPPRVLLLSRTAPPHRVHVPLFWATTVPIPGDIYLPFLSNFVADFPTWNIRLGMPPLASTKQNF
jgi:hypothetical protein